ncbi:MAG: hypothetical protein AAGC56_15420 [Pseudomonadota bacterium]
MLNWIGQNFIFIETFGFFAAILAFLIWDYRKTSRLMADSEKQDKAAERS